MDPYFYLLIRLLSVFFFFLSRCKQNKIKLCYNRLQFVKETQTNTVKHRTESQTTQIISFSLIFTRSYLPVQNLGDRHPNTIELASWLVHVLCDFKATWHQETSVSLEYAIKIHLPDTYIFCLFGESPPSTLSL